MSSSPSIRSFTGESPRVVGDDAATTLARIAAERRTQDAAAARELEQVAHWADLHRADLPAAVAGTVLASGTTVQVPATEYSEQLGGPVLGMEDVLQLAGEGTFAITEFAVCEVAV